jgi:hypothetical protein
MIGDYMSATTAFIAVSEYFSSFTAGLDLE